MSFALRQSTAQTIRVGPFVDTAGAVVTSLTIAQADRKWSKNGGAFAQTSDTNSATHDTGGFYSFSVTATDSEGHTGVATVVVKRGTREGKGGTTLPPRPR